MIIDLSIRNFGPIKDEQTLSFEATKDMRLENYYVVEALPNLRLLKCAIIYEPNASGKSTIVEAIEFLRDLVLHPEDQKNNNLDFNPFLFDDASRDATSVIALSFVHNAIRYSYKVEFTTRCIISERLYYYPKGRQADLFVRTTDVHSQTSQVQFGSTVKVTSKDLIVLNGNTLWNNTVLGAFTKSNVLIPALREAVEWFTSSLFSMISPTTDLFAWTSNRVEGDTAFKAAIIKLLKEADIQIDDLEIELKEQEIDETTLNLLSQLLADAGENRLEVLKETRKLITKDVVFHHTVTTDRGRQTYKLSSILESNGTRRYYGLSGILATLMDRNKVLSIDEIETSLHPDLVQHFILKHLAHSTSSQLLITTHNLFLLDNQDVLRRDAVWFTQKQDNGATELFSLADFSSATIRQGISILNSYKIGKLGAKPQLGNVLSG